MRCTVEKIAMLGALFLAAAPLVLRADSPPENKPNHEAPGGSVEEAKPEGGDENDPLAQESTKRFMRFGSIPDRFRNDGAPKVGEVAPPLKLKTLDGKEEVDLASFEGEKPVVLIFGSYT